MNEKSDFTGMRTLSRTLWRGLCVSLKLYKASDTDEQSETGVMQQ